MEEMDKLLEDLQKVSVEFNNQLSKYEALIYHTKQTNDKLEKYTESNRDKVDRLCIRVENKLKEMNQRVEEITEDSKEIFEKYSADVASLNEEEREAFCAVLLGELGRYKKEFLHDVLGDYQKILQVFMEKIHREADYVISGQRDISTLVKNNEETNQELVTQIHGLRVIVNGCLEAINHTIAGMNDSYMTIFGEFSKQVNSVNKEDRERFIKALSQTLDTYKADFGMYNTLLQEQRQVNQELSALTLQNTENVQAMEQQIAAKLKQTEKLLEHINQAYEKGFSSFSKDVSVLNSRERENLIVAVRSMLEEYRFTFGNEIESKSKEMNVLLQNTLIASCNTFASRIKEYQILLEKTKNSNVEVHDSLQRTLMEIEGLTMSLMRREDYIQASLEFMKEDYKNAVRGYVQEIERSNGKERELLEKNTVQNMSKMMDRFLHQLEMFKNERTVYKQQLETLIKEEQEDREDLLRRQAEMINRLKEEQIMLREKLEEKQESMNRYQMVTNAVIMVLLVICLLLQVPWENTKFLAFVGLPVVVILGILLIVFRKRIVQWIYILIKR